MPGSLTTRDRSGPCDAVSVRVAFRTQYGVGIPVDTTFAAQWLAYALPCRRFAETLADADARLGAGVGR